MDVSDEHQQRIELRRCIAAYYAGLYKVAKTCEGSFTEISGCGFI